HLTLRPYPPLSTHFPYTTLFRSLAVGTGEKPDSEDDQDQASQSQLECEEHHGSTPSRSRSATTAGSTRERAREGTRPKRIKRARSEEHTSELQSRSDLVCRLLLE